MYVVPFVLSIGFLAKGGIVLRRRRQQAVRWPHRASCGHAAHWCAVSLSLSLCLCPLQASGAPPPSQELDTLDDDSQAAFAADGSELPGGDDDGGEGGHGDHHHDHTRGANGWRPGESATREHGAPDTPASRLGGLRPSALELGSASYSASATALPDGGPAASPARPGGPVRAGSAAMLRSLESLTPKFARAGARGQGYERLLADGSAASDDAPDDGDGGGDHLGSADQPPAAVPAATTSPVDKVAPHGAGATMMGPPTATSHPASAAALARTTSSGSATSAVRRTSVVSLLHEATTVITVPALERQHVPVWTIKPRPPQLSPNATTSWRDWWRTHFQPDDELLKRRLTKRSLRLGLMGVFSAIMVRGRHPSPHCAVRSYA
jgi:hypothetical protein